MEFIKGENKKMNTYFKPTLKAYGKRKVYHIKRRNLILIFCLFCLLTPCTNWLLPFSNKIIKNNLRIVRFK